MFNGIKRVNPNLLDKKITKIIKVSKVVRATKGGRRFRYRTLIVLGNGMGIIGYGLGKSKDFYGSFFKAENSAKKNLFKINIYNRSLPHEWCSKHGGSHIFIKPASNGTGLIAGSVIRNILEVLGVDNVLSKNLGSTNPFNVIIATFKALLNLRNLDNILQERGISKKNYNNEIRKFKTD
jgi:small subunit ribosomal protein S5